MEDLNGMKGRCNCKYLWVHNDFDRWCSEMSKQIKESQGFNIGKAGITKLLYNNVLLPKRISTQEVLNSILNRKRQKR